MKRSMAVKRSHLLVVYIAVNIMPTTRIFLKFMLTIIKISITKALICDEVLEYPDSKKFTLQELQTIPPTEIIECLAHLGKEQMEPQEADFIWQTIIKHYEGIVNIPDRVLTLLHWVTPAILPEQYENITLSNINVIENFGLNYKLNQAQLSAIADRIHENFAGKEPEDFTFYDLTALRQILCAYNRSEIERINPAAYREAALTIGKLENCSPEVMLGFATLAVQKRAFGSIETWTDKTLHIIGSVAEYLPQEIVDEIRSQSSMTRI